MNCKPGDLVILLRAKNPKMMHYVGSIRTVRAPSLFHCEHWYTDPPVIGRNGLEASWNDKDMRPIRDQDGEDEMLRIAGYPHKETA